MQQEISATRAKLRDQKYQQAEALIKDIPGVSIGYIGNVYSDGRDDRSWYIFLAHPGRVGGWNDRIGGYPTEERFRLIGAATTLRAGYDLAVLGVEGASAKRFQSGD